MVDFAYVQDKVYFGYGKAAEKIGQEVNIYRSATGIDPLDSDNLVGQTFLSQNVDWNYNKANKYGNAVWQLVIDGREIQKFDYLVNDTFTFFVIAMEPLLPILGVECTRTVSILRASKTQEPGANPYGGYELEDVSTLATSLPVSALAGGRMETNSFKLPLDTRSPSYVVLIPALTGIDLRIGDFVDDERGVRLALTSVELTDFGYRCIATSEQA